MSRRTEPSDPPEPASTAGRGPLWTGGALLLGLALLLAVVAWQGVEAVVEGFRQASLRVLWLPVFYGVLVLPFVALSWRTLFPGDERPSWWRLVYATLVGTAANWLLPVAQVGGEVIKARLVLRGNANTSATVAGASVVADKTVQAVSVVATTFVGLAVLVAVGDDRRVVGAALVGGILLAILTYVFLRAQRRGLFTRLARLGRGLGFRHGLGEAAGDLDDTLVRLYGDPGRIAWAVIWRLAARAVMVGEVWMALHFLDLGGGLGAALVLDFLSQTVRAAVFLVPAGLGVQEGAFALLATAVGVPPGAGVAISLMRRVREVVLGVPALAAWQVEEGGRLLDRVRRSERPPGPP